MRPDRASALLSHATEHHLHMGDNEATNIEFQNFNPKKSLQDLKVHHMIT